MTLDILEFEEVLIVDGLEVGVSLDLDLVPLINIHGLLDDVDLFDCELNPAKFDDVSALHYVLDFLILVLEASNHEVHMLVQRLR